MSHKVSMDQTGKVKEVHGVAHFNRVARTRRGKRSVPDLLRAITSCAALVLPCVHYAVRKMTIVCSTLCSHQSEGSDYRYHALSQRPSQCL